MQSYPVSLLKSMLETYSPSGSETHLARLLRTELNAHGFTTRIDNTGNVMGEAGKEGPRILLCGHMDTIPGELAVKIEDGFAYGRGAVDAKSSLAAMIAGCILARERSPLPFHATLAGVVEEETSSRGIKAVISQGRSYDLAVFGEPSGISNIIVGYKGAVQLEVFVLTRGGHSASPWLSKSSFEEAVGFWTAIRNSVLDNYAESRFSSVTGCITRIAAGDQTNTIPSRTLMQIDIRVPPHIKTADIAKKIEKLAEAYQEKNNDLQLRASVKDQTEAYLGDENSLGVRTFRAAIRKVTGREIVLVRKTGTSDMNHLAQSSKIPMIAYGPGDSSLDHTALERVSLEEYQKSVEVYATAIQRFAALMRESPLLPTAAA